MATSWVDMSSFRNIIYPFQVVVFLTTETFIFITIVAIDYDIQATFSSRYSPMKLVATYIAEIISMPVKMVDAAPRLFTSGVGFLFAFASLLLFEQNLFASLVIAKILLVFALLDSVFNYCVGCLSYHYIVFPLFGKGRS